jgi:hypothetical protein
VVKQEKRKNYVTAHTVVKYFQMHMDFGFGHACMHVPVLHTWCGVWQVWDKVDRQ